MEETKVVETMIDVSNPLVLHHLGHSRIVFVSKLLEGYNYRQWSRAMHISLSAKNKIKFINGSIEALASIDPKFPICR